MPKPIELCIQDLDAPVESPVYVRCVALAGGEPGLGLSATGEILWQRDAQVACEIWVSLDEQLIVFRPEGAPPVGLSRAGRRLDAPCGKPIVVLDQDELDIGTRRFRLHVHGEAAEVAPPTVVVPSAVARMTRAAVAALALAAAAGGCMDSKGANSQSSEVWPITESDPTKTPPIQVRSRPPDVRMAPPPQRQSPPPPQTPPSPGKS